MWSRTRIAVLLAASFLLAGAGPAAAQVDTVETWAGSMGLPVIAQVGVGDLAPIYGRSHVAYTRDGRLRHARKDIGAWQIEDVNGDAATSYDMAVDGDGLVTIAYATPDGRLMCVQRTPVGWDVDTVASSPGASFWPSVALGPVPAIAYLECASGSCALRYARRSGGGWTVMPLDAATGSPFPPSLAFDIQGRPHIAYGMAAPTSSGSALEILDGASPSGPFSATVVDTEGIGPFALAWDLARQRARIAYTARHIEDEFGDFHDEYRFAFQDAGSAWQNEPVSGPLTSTFASVSLALDPVGSPGVGWLSIALFGPSLTGGLTACGYVETGSVALSRQLPAVPSSPFQPVQITRAGSQPDAILGRRAVASREFGTFAVAWREPRISCPPYQVLFTEISSGAADVPIGTPASSVALRVGPNPRTGNQPIEMSWSLGRGERLEFLLYDVSGRIIARDAADWYPAGPHSRAWQPGRLPAGLYWVSLQTGHGRLATRALVSH